MANIKAKDLGLDSKVEGDELIVSTDGDGVTRNIKSQMLADYATDQAIKEINSSIKDKDGNEVGLEQISNNAKDIEDLAAKVKELEDYHTEHDSPWMDF